jgi:hypothetical protein
LVTALAEEQITLYDFVGIYKNMNNDRRAEVETILGEAVRREPDAASS